MLLAWELLSPHASNQEVHMAEEMLWRGFKNTRFSEDLYTAPLDRLLSASDIPLRVSKAVLLRHLTPRTSMSLNFRLQKHLNVVESGTRKEKKGGMKWMRVGHSHIWLQRWNSFKFQEQGGRKKENYSSTSRHHSGVLSWASSSLRCHLLLSLHGEVGAAHSDVRTAPSAFCCNSQRERNEKKARRSETERGRGRWGEKMEKLCQSNAGEKMGVNKRDGGGIKGEFLEESSHSFWHK